MQSSCWPFSEGVLALLGDTSVSADFYVGSIVETMTVTIQPVAVIEPPTVGSRVVVSAESPLPNDAGTVSATVPFLVLYNAETEAVMLQDETEEGEYQVAVNADKTGEAIKALLGKRGATPAAAPTSTQHSTTSAGMPEHGKAGQP